MQVSSKLLFRTAIVLLGIMLAMTVLVTVNSQQANALSPTQWETVRGYVAEYFGGPQYDAGLDGEAGFRMNKTELWNRLDSNGNIAPNAGAGLGSAGTAVTGVLGEGDDAANRPVLIDNLYSQGNVIPGTEFRCNWSANENCFSDASISTIRQIVDNHQAAGFSTDIVDYCLSAHTAAPTTGGFGIIAQVPGALASDTSLTPNVYTFEWARNGWRDQLSNPPAGALAIAAPETSAGGFAAPSTVVSCDASATDYDLVRCQANWAISSTGGNTGNGQTSTATIGAAGQSVDIRTGSISTMSSAGTNLQLPIDTLFSASSLANIDPSKTVVMVSRTQMGGDAAIGLEMLGYNNIVNSYINGGIYRWSAAAGGELQVDQNIGLPLQSLAAYTAPGTIDTTAPSVTSVAAQNVSYTTAEIYREAGEPATMKVEYGTAPGVYTATANDTVLNQNKTVGLSGLSEGTTYYYKATSYDGYANGTVSSEGSFTTLVSCAAGKPSLSLGAPSAFWASYADYTNKQLSVTWTVSNTGSTDASAVQIDSSNATYAPITTMTTMPAVIGSVDAGLSGGTVVKYQLPGYGPGFRVVNTGSATDCAANGYTYP